MQEPANSIKAKTKTIANTQPIAEFTIPANGSHKVKLGRFQHAGPAPDFAIYWHPDDAPHVVSFNDVKLEHDDGDYSLYRNFQNYGDKECRVTIHRQT